MEYSRTTSDAPVLEVANIQRMLNKAKQKAELLVEEDKINDASLKERYVFQEIHHQDKVPSDWPYPLREDGVFGFQTERAVKAFQKFVFIQENGIVGNYTMAKLQLMQTAQPSFKRILNPLGDVLTPIPGGVRDQIRSGDLMPDGSPIPSPSKSSGNITGKIWNGFVFVSPQIAAANSLYEKVTEWVKGITGEINNLNMESTSSREKRIEKAEEIYEKATKNTYTYDEFNKYRSTAPPKDPTKAKKKNLKNFILALSKSFEMWVEANPFVCSVTKIVRALESSPIGRYLLKFIPFLNYAPTIGKIVSAILEFGHGNWEKAIDDIVVAIWLFLEAQAINWVEAQLAVGAVMFAGPELAALIAIIILFIVVDYFLFNENPGDTWVDKNTPLCTMNVVQQVHSFVTGKTY